MNNFNGGTVNVSADNNLGATTGALTIKLLHGRRCGDHAYRGGTMTLNGF